MRFIQAENYSEFESSLKLDERKQYKLISLAMMRWKIRNISALRTPKRFNTNSWHLITLMACSNRMKIKERTSFRACFLTFLMMPVSLRWIMFLFVEVIRDIWLDVFSKLLEQSQTISRILFVSNQICLKKVLSLLKSKRPLVNDTIFENAEPNPHKQRTDTWLLLRLIGRNMVICLLDWAWMMQNLLKL